MFTLYELAIRMYGLLIRLASLFNSKASAWTIGRQSLWNELEKKYNHTHTDFWFHCASLGEFEQGRPVIEAIRRECPSANILLTFFSPSGFQVRKNYQEVDAVLYLPLDTKQNMQRFLDLTKPGCAIFIKYEFWYRLLYELDMRNVPTYLVSGLFRPEQIFFRWYGGFFRKQLGRFNKIYVQDTYSTDILENAGINQVVPAGDTRVDRVIQNSRSTRSFAQVEKTIKDRPVIILGSTWPEDEAILIPVINDLITSGWCCIMAPHEIDKAHLSQLTEAFEHPVRTLTELELTSSIDADIILIDRIGILSELYQYSRIAYVGGAFGDGLHNILEAVAFHQGVIFGPKYEHFNEAVELLKRGVAKSITNKKELKFAITEFAAPENQDGIQLACRDFLKQHSGATALIVPELLATFKDERP